MNEVNLAWNHYSGTTGILYYVIYRKNPGSTSFVPIDSVNINTNNYTDFNAPSGLTEYQVAGVLSNPCILFQQTNSRDYDQMPFKSRQLESTENVPKSS